MALGGKRACFDRLAQDTYKAIIVELKRRIFAVYKRRPKLILEPQRQLTVRFSSASLQSADHAIPSDAQLTLSGGAAAVFGLPANVEGTPIAWQQFFDLVAESPLVPFWRMTLQRILQSAYNLSGVEADRSVIASHNQAQLFRLELTTCKMYFDGTIVASIYFFEVRPRQPIGNPETTMLLNGLQLVCRFRFLFLENKSEFHFANIQLRHDKRLAVIADQITRELDLLRSDSTEAKLDQPTAWTDYVDYNQLVAMSAEWMPLERELRDACADALTARDGANEPHRTKLAEILQRTCRIIRPHNDVLLNAMAQKLVSYARLDDACPPGVIEAPRAAANLVPAAHSMTAASSAPVVSVL